MKQYCPTCGAATEYSFKKPKFCNSCGQSFGSVSKLPAKRVLRPSPVNPIEIVKEEEPEEEATPDLDIEDLFEEDEQEEVSNDD